ncbi:MAG TPA: ABC transporter ATP-binding protein [Solirubrobacteraceae bacterium]|jgi:oligopeptide/dipeptide ABC transporter ATP-binding protein|nr:ABC transporter ATP-binding protein [Solirubrobacteraceae bacterium]
MGASLLEVRDLAIEIADWEPVKDVSFEVAGGECVAIVGETGSGKTLTCRAITGMLRRRGGSVVRGSARFDGIDLLTLTERQWLEVRGRRISLVPQSSMAGLDPIMRVGRQLEETIRFIAPADDPRKRARELLDHVHMARADEVLRLYPHELSGGMRQRIMIAFALVGRPELIVADEPTTALDVTLQRNILRLLKELQAETALSVILVTHDLGVVEEVADSVTIMYAGRVVEAGPAAKVLGAPAHPYTCALLAARPLTVGPGEELLAIPGLPPGPADRASGCPFAPRCARAQARCDEAVPQLETVDDLPGHLAACWLARSGDDAA